MCDEVGGQRRVCPGHTHLGWWLTIDRALELNSRSWFYQMQADFGQVLHLDAIDGMRVFIRALLGFGIEAADVKTIVIDTPAALLGLPPFEG